MRNTIRSLVFAMALPWLCPAVTVGQIDTFQDGTTEGWVVGLGPVGGVHPAPPVNVTGGIGGPLDHFLELTALGGNGPGSKLAVMNVAQWSGDYISTQVGGISMDVRNAGATDLSLRLLFERLGPMGPTDIAFSRFAIPLAAGGGWTSIYFPVNPTYLTTILGDTQDLLRNTDVLRIFHGVEAGFPPEGSIAASLYVDNIRAISEVPEPSAALLTASAFGMLGFVARRRSRSRRALENR